MEKTETKTAKKSTSKKQTKKSQKNSDVIDMVNEVLKTTEEKVKNTEVEKQKPTAPAEEDLRGEAFYSGKFKPANAKELSSSEGGSIRVMQETWSYEDRNGNQQQSTKIAVRPVYRRRDGNLFYAEPIVNIHANKWEEFKKLMHSIKA